MTKEPFSNLGMPERDDTSPEEDRPRLPSDAVPFDELDVEDGQEGARLSYLFNFVCLPFCLIPMIRRDSGFSLFHAKQAFALWIGLFGLILCAQLVWILWFGIPALMLINGLGYLQVKNEWARPLPFLRTKPQEWFHFFTMEEEEDE